MLQKHPQEIVATDVTMDDGKVVRVEFIRPIGMWRALGEVAKFRRGEPSDLVKPQPPC